MGLLTRQDLAAAGGPRTAVVVPRLATARRLGERCLWKILYSQRRWLREKLLGRIQAAWGGSGLRRLCWRKKVQGAG